MSVGSTRPRRVAVVADTAHRLPPGLLELGALEQLEHFAPVTAVTGHEDYVAYADRFPALTELEVDGARLLLTNMIGTPPHYLPHVQRRLEDDPPDVVVHGHPPAPQVLWIGGTLFLNPGSVAGAAPGRPGTCGLLEIAGPGRITGHILELGPGRGMVSAGGR